MKKIGLKFGIYPLSVAGTPFGLAEGAKDDYEKIIKKHNKVLKSIQITNEPNLSFMEGAKPYIMEALIRGVIETKKLLKI